MLHPEKCSFICRLVTDELWIFKVFLSKIHFKTMWNRYKPDPAWEQNFTNILYYHFLKEHLTILHKMLCQDRKIAEKQIHVIHFLTNSCRYPSIFWLFLKLIYLSTLWLFNYFSSKLEILALLRGGLHVARAGNIRKQWFFFSVWYIPLFSYG